MDGPWTTLEKLALAKSVFKCPEGDWNAVSRTLKLIHGQSRVSDFFSQKNCAAQYARLVKQADEVTSNGPDQVDSEQVPDVGRIAKHLYLQRIEELKKAIQKDDDTFRNISHELVEIRQGKWDERLVAVNADETTDTILETKICDEDKGNENIDSQEERVTDEHKSNMASQQISSETTENSNEQELSNEAQPIGKEEFTREENIAEEVEPNKDNEVAKVDNEDLTMDSTGHILDDDKQTAVSSESENGTIELTTDVPDAKMEMAEEVSNSNESIPMQPHEPSDADSKNAKPEATVTAPLQPTSPAKQHIPPENNEDAGSTQKEVGPDSEPAEDGNKERPLTRLRKRTLSGVLDMLPPSTTTGVDKDPKVGSTKDEIVEPQLEDDAQEGHGTVSQDAPSSREAELADDAMMPAKKKVKKTALRRDSEDAESNISSDVDLSDAGSGPHSLRSPSYASSRLTPPGVMIGDAERTKRWRKLILPIWSHIANHRHGPMFMQSIREKEAPGYYSAVKRPMSLSDVKKRVTSGAITTTAEFHRDVLQVFANALMYNKENTDIYGMATELHADAQRTIKQHVQTERAVTRRDSCGPSGRRKSDSVASVSDEVYTPPVNRSEPNAENQDFREASTPGDVASL